MPTNYTLDIPGHADLPMKIDDTLVIKFISAAKFCVISGNRKAFDPELPADFSGTKGSQWPSTGSAKAIGNATITYSHCEPHEQCGKSRNPAGGITGTIKVGTGR